MAESIHVTWRAGASSEIMCRLTERPPAPKVEGPLIPRAAFASITLSVVDRTPPAPVAVAGFEAVELSPADVILNEPLGWHVDRKGCNFRYVLPGEAMPLAGRVYAVVVWWELVDGRRDWTEWRGRSVGA